MGIKNIGKKIIAPIALAIGISGGISGCQTATSPYWEQLQGYYTSSSQIKLQPCLTKLHKYANQKKLNDEEINELKTTLYYEIPQRLEQIKVKYFERLYQLQGRTKLEFSKEEVEKRLKKNQDTIQKVVPQLVNIYISMIEKLTNERFEKYIVNTPITPEKLKIYN